MDDELHALDEQLDENDDDELHDDNEEDEQLELNDELLQELDDELENVPPPKLSITVAVVLETSMIAPAAE